MAAEREQEFYECGRLRWVESVAICRHVSASLQNLPDDLILGHVRSSGVESRPAHAACTSDRVTVSTLLVLQNQRALSFKWSSIL